jgi:spermidine/putrescine-binding protein
MQSYDDDSNPANSGRRDFLSRMGKVGLAGAGAAIGGIGITFRPQDSRAQSPSGSLRLSGITSLYTRDKDLKPFYDEYKGVKIELTPWTSNSDQANKLAADNFRQFDLSTLGVAFVEPLMKRKLLAPIDSKRIPNFQYVFEPFRQPSWGSMDGSLYALLYHWGFDTMVYNADFIKEDVDSWLALFDDRYKGRIALRDDPVGSITVAAFALGYKNPRSELEGADLRKVRDFLISKKPLIRALWTGIGEATNLLRTKEVWITMGQSSMWLELQREGMNVRFPWVLKEPVINFGQTYVMSPHTQVPDICYAYLNYVLSRDYGARILRDHGEFSSSRLFVDGVGDKEKKEFALDRINEIVSKYRPVSFTAKIQEWNNAWSEFKAA